MFPSLLKSFQILCAHLQLPEPLLLCYCWSPAMGYLFHFSSAQRLPPVNKVWVYHNNNAVSDLQPGSCLMAGLARRALLWFAIIAAAAAVMTQLKISSWHTIHQTAGKENNGNDDKEVRKRSRMDHAADCARLDPLPVFFFFSKNHVFRDKWRKQSCFHIRNNKQDGQTHNNHNKRPNTM